MADLDASERDTLLKVCRKVGSGVQAGCIKLLYMCQLELVGSETCLGPTAMAPCDPLTLVSFLGSLLTQQIFCQGEERPWEQGYLRSPSLFSKFMYSSSC